MIPAVAIVPLAGSEPRELRGSPLVAQNGAIGEALAVDLRTIEDAVVDLLDAIGADLLALETAGLGALDLLGADIAALDPSIGPAHADRTVPALLGLDGRAAVTFATVGESKRLALDAGTLGRAHLKAATVATVDVGANLSATASAAAAILDAECVSASASATADLIVATTASLGVSAAFARGRSGTIAAAFATALLAGLGARWHRYRQSGDTRS